MTECPPRDELPQLLDGAPDDPTVAAFAAHLEECAACQQALDQLTADAPFWSDPGTVTGDAGGTTRDDGENFLRRLKAVLPAGTVAPAGSPPTRTGDPREVPERLPEVAGYEVLEVLGRGGMGVVFKARHLRLNRLVAIKMILGGGYHSQAAQVRFMIEAEAVAQLDHPHVVGVYEFGTHDGLPFFALEYLGGGTLAGKIRDGRFAPRPAAELVVKLADGIAAAHAKGIVHRDLKPANILLGEFGEPKVADFGLAKVGHSDMTATGAVMGTPSYMSPEQAGGRVREVGTPTDVYALGAILYELLTGRPPFRGDTAMATVQQVLTREPEPPRAVEPSIPRDLETICLKCLAKDPKGRYGTAEALGADLRAFLDGRPISARPVGALERTWKWAKRHPARAGGLVAGLLLSAGLALAWNHVQGQREADRRDAELRLGRNAEAVAALLDRFEEALWAGDVAKSKVVQEAAERRAAEGGAEGLADRFARLREDLAIFEEIVAADRFACTPIENKIPGFRALADRYSKVLQRAGIDPEGDLTPEAAARVENSAVRDRLVPVLDLLLGLDLLQLKPGSAAKVRAALRRLDPDPFRDAVRDAALAYDAPRVAALAEGANVATQPGGFIAMLGMSPGVPVARQQALLKEAIHHRSGELALLLLIGHTYPSGQRANADERVRWYQAAVAAAPGNPAARNLLGITLRDRGDLDGAVAEFKEAARLDPNFAPPRYNLGLAYEKQKKFDAAAEQFKEASRLDPGSAVTHNRLGLDYLAQKNLDAAVAEFKEALGIDPTLASARNNLGVAYDRQKKLDAAVVEFEEAVRLNPKDTHARGNLGSAYERLGKRDAAVAEYRELVGLEPDSATAHRRLGIALARQAKWDEAAVELKEAVRLDPKDAVAHSNLGSVYFNLRKPEAAQEEYQEALRIEPEYAAAHYNLGVVYGRQGKRDAAVAEYKEALRIDPDHASAHANMGEILRDRGDLDGAVTELTTAIRINPEDAFAHNNLGLTYARQKKFDAAFEEYKEAVRLEPKNTDARSNLGWAYHQQKNYAAAVAEFKELVRIAPKDSGALYGLGWSHQLRGDLDAAVVAYKEAVRLEPDYMMAHTRLGFAYEQQGNLDGAVAEFKELVRLEPKNGVIRARLAGAYERRGDLDAAVAEYKEAVRLDPKNPRTRNNLGVVYGKQGKSDESVAEYKEAVRLDPNYALPRINLGSAYQRRGDLDAAVAEFKEAVRIVPKDARAQTALTNAERMRELLPRLPGVLSGVAEPKSAAEACEFAKLCGQPFQKQYADAVRLSEKAFADDPKLAADLEPAHRYDAACHAALAGRGAGVNAPAGADERAVLRAKALTWLREDLTLRRAQAASPAAPERKTADEKLTHWLNDADLSGVRPGLSRIGLPADERAVWDAFWADVKATIREAQQPPPPVEVAPPPRPKVQR